MISVIIPITGANRKENAEACIHFLQKQSIPRGAYEVVLIEQVNAILAEQNLGGPFYENLHGVDKYLAIQDPGDNHFNQPWMANVGARIASGDKFVFYDIDLVCDSSYLRFVSDFDIPYFIAWHKMFALSEPYSQQVKLTKNIPAPIPKDCEIYDSGPLAYAGFSACATRKFFFEALGGYNENYLGWGGNDNDIAWRAKELLGKETVLRHRLFHLWHPKGYAQAMLWHRRGVWLTTYKNPKKVTERLKKVRVGDHRKPTFIDIRDIYVDPIKEQQRKKALRQGGNHE